MAELDIFSIVLVLLGSGSFFASVGVVYFQYRYQKLQILQEKLRDERRKIYFDVLNPFFMLFSKPSRTKEATELLQSPVYRKTGFELTIIGSDDVVKSYIELMQFFYKSGNENSLEPAGTERTKKMIHLMGDLFLKIRKDLGNDKTKLTDVEMLKHMISDIEKIDQTELR